MVDRVSPETARLLQDLDARRLQELADDALRAELNEAIIEAAPNGVVVVDHAGKIVRVNALIETTFGYSRKELVGHSIEILLPEKLRPGHMKHRTNYQADPRLRPMGIGLEVLGRRKTGQEFPLTVTLAPLIISLGAYYLAIVGQPPSPPAPVEQALSILIVEDNAEFAAMFVKALTSAGYETDLASTGESALALLRSRSYALAVIDLTLPDITGIEVATLAHGDGCQVPMVAISGSLGLHDAERLASAGFVETMEKPLRLSQLMDLIGRYVKCRRANDQPGIPDGDIADQVER